MHSEIIEKIQFASEDVLLKGYLHWPSTPHPPCVIGSHGLLSDKDSPKQIALAKHCNAHHMAYFRFDHRGCGESKAPLDTVTSLTARCTDLLAAAKMLRSRGDLSRHLGLFGSSMGGSVCLAVARDLSADAIVTWAAPLRSTDLVTQQTETTGDSNSPFEKHPFDILDSIAGLQRLLIVHGDADEIVPLSHAHKIYEHVSEPKKLLVFPQGDHRMSALSDQQVFVKESTLWFKRFLVDHKN
jgi:alpha-beta hydrolase superfamily lysophospholipase